MRGAGALGKKTVIWFIWFVSFIWLNQTNQMNQKDQKDRACATRGDHRSSAVSKWFFVACEAWNCCYRSSASVASDIFIRVRMFFCPATPGHGTGRSGRLLGRANEVQIGIHSRPA